MKIKKHKEKIWKTKTADTKFSEEIRKRDGKCLRCNGTENLQCSHFWSRQHSSTRFDFKNCITLCYSCHYGNAKGWEYDQPGGYRDFMIKRLGEEDFIKLEAKHYKTMKLRDAVLEFMKIYKENLMAVDNSA
jgi:hypothetical protein